MAGTLSRRAPRRAAEIQQQERTAEPFEEVFQRLWGRSVVWALKSGARDLSQAEAAASNAWFAVHRAWKRYDPAKGGYASWIRRIVHNETVSLLRRRYARDVPLASDGGGTHALVEDDGLSASTSLGNERSPAEPAICVAFRALEEVHPGRAAVLRLAADGLDAKAIGERLGITETAVACRRSRGRDFVAERLAEMGCVLVAHESASRAEAAGAVRVCTGPAGDGWVVFSFHDEDGLRAAKTAGAGWDLVCDAFHLKLWRRER